jgi:hypothetical protein
VHSLQVWRRSKTHLHFVHWYFWKYKTWYPINICFKSFFFLFCPIVGYWLIPDEFPTSGWVPSYTYILDGCCAYCAYSAPFWMELVGIQPI